MTAAWLQRGLSIGSVLVFTLVWELSLQLDWVDGIFLASPSQILERAAEMFGSGEIFPHLAVSLQEGVYGFVLSLVVGIILGLLMGRFALVRHVLEPWAIALYSTPSVALLPLFILWFGIGLWSKVLVVFLSTIFAIMVNTQAGVQNCSPKLVETARAFTASEWDIFFGIMLPAAVPFIVAGIRLAIGRMLIAVFVAELYASSRGLGFVIVQAGSQFDTPTLFVGVLILTLTGVILSQLLLWAERNLLQRFQEH
jgi:ABC-type nitrate/sulfonate/bicarbonate transport system permease component